MGEKVRFSVVLPCFNSADTVERAIRSVLGQTLRDFELLVVDDGSSDKTRAVLAQLTAGEDPGWPSVQVIIQENLGTGAARNNAVRHASGTFVSFIDADDFWDPSYLERVDSVFEAFPEAGVVATNAWLVYRNRTIPAARHESALPRVIPNYFLERARGTLRVCTSGVSLRRDLIGRVGYMREDLRRAQDSEYWARLTACGAGWAYLPEPLVYYDAAGQRSLSRAPASSRLVPLPECWGRDIWPLLDGQAVEDFRKHYVARAKSQCGALLRTHDYDLARATAKEAAARTTDVRTRLLLLLVSHGPLVLSRALWRVMRWVRGRPSG